MDVASAEIVACAGDPTVVTGVVTTFMNSSTVMMVMMSVLELLIIGPSWYPVEMLGQLQRRILVRNSC